MLANLAGFGAATSLFPWEFSTGLCHCMSLLKGGVATGPDVAGGKRTPDVAVFPLRAGRSKWGRSSLRSPKPGRDRNEPQERLRSWKGNSQRR